MYKYLFILLLSLNSIMAFELAPPQSSIQVKSLPHSAWGIETSKVWTLGNQNNIEHVWFLMHGDTPKFYEAELAKGRQALHRKLLERDVGAILIQPLAKSWKKLKVPAGQGYGDIYGKTSGGIKNTKHKFEYPRYLVKTFFKFKNKLQNPRLKFQLMTFSGSGRVDRALHEYLTYFYNKDASIKNFVDHEFMATIAVDAMVNWSFKDSKTKPLKKSWINFLSTFPHINSVFVLDTKRTYSYMYDIAMDIKNELAYDQVLILKGEGHKGTLFTNLEHGFIID